MHKIRGGFPKPYIPEHQHDVEARFSDSDTRTLGHSTSIRFNLRLRLAALIVPAFLFLPWGPWVLASDPPSLRNGVAAGATVPGFVELPTAPDISISGMGAPTQKEQCLCNLDHVKLETNKRKPGDPFNGNPALLFTYAKALSDIIAPDMGNTDSRMALYLTPPFYPGIAVEEPDPTPLMNYQLWQYADSLLLTDSPVWDYDGGSYFDFYSEYLSYASVNGSLQGPNPKARNDMLHLFGQLKAAAKAVDKAKADAIVSYKQAVLQATEGGGTLPPELRNLTAWIEENASYSVSQENLNEITQLYNYARTKYYGPGVQELSDLLAKVSQAKEYLKPVEGNLNMPCMSSPQSWAERLEEARTGRTSTSKSPGDIFYKPKYGFDADYIETVTFWSNEYRNSPNQRPIFKISLDDLRNVDVDRATLGFPNIDKGRDEDTPPKDTILSLQTKTKTLTPQVEEIIISATNWQTFSINSGDWDKPDFRLSSPRLRADAPIRFTAPIVRPCRLLFAYGVQIDVRVNNSDVKEFAYELDNMAGKGTTLLGATRSLQVKGDMVTTQVEGDPDPGYPYLLAVLGVHL
ncbi:hypothetical protein TWF481_011104 [Arthrobotrys musiformis]|uniref:Uncharacterized protein n=1 Tax=Arthrobotrys musiformis TaxID=47236 RepID=A0AAV9W0A3_9PEZI